MEWRFCRPDPGGRDKGMVEGAVKVVQTVVLLALRDVVFFSMEEMNRAILDE